MGISTILILISTVGLVIFILTILKIALDPFVKLTSKKSIMGLIFGISLFVIPLVYGTFQGIIPLEAFNVHEINVYNNHYILLAVIFYLFIYPLFHSKKEKNK